MKKLWAGACLILLAAAPLPAQKLEPTKEDIQDFRNGSSSRSYPSDAILAWESDLRKTLEKLPPAKAADAIAAQHGFTSSDMRRLVVLAIIAEARQYDRDTAWKAAAQTELLSLVPSARSAPAGLTLIAETLDMIEECRASDFTALMAGSTDAGRDAYAIATAATCDGNFARATIAAGDRAMPVLLRFVDWGSLPAHDTMALHMWLTSPAALARIAEADRPAMTIWLWQRYLSALLRQSLNRRALALYDGLPANLRNGIVSPSLPPKTATVDGIAMTFTKGYYGAPQTDAPILDLAEALTVANREAEARALLATLPGLAKAKAASACAYTAAGSARRKADPRPGCPTEESTRDLPMQALVLDHLLNNWEADPYPIAETVFGDSEETASRAAAEIRCRVFPEKDFANLCSDARKSGGPENHALNFSEDDSDAGEAALTRAVPNFAQYRADLIAEMGPPADTVVDRSARPTIAAEAPPFAVKPLPPQYRGTAKAPSLTGLAQLPAGFIPVRAERTGQRVVVISVSQTYDPTGEISQGGYWVHLSDDGGKSWQKPLYTGLADRFPYVVHPVSRLPLIDGDTLNIAADIAEIDTASITYPPVGLRSRRHERDLVLTIPLADLKRDSDGDGLTDMAARHLLLDRAKTADKTPFMVGTDDRATCTAPTAERLALIGLLGQLIDPSGRAIVEPIDRAGGEYLTGLQGAAAADSQPLFILGKREDFLCLRPSRPIIVYGPDDIKAIEHFTPAFHTFALPPIIFNRARDRGYVKWSTGWAGGTFRLRRLDGHWLFESMSEWVS